jgi:hypothetical protein
MKRNAIIIASLCFFAMSLTWGARAQEVTASPNIVGSWDTTIHRSKADGNLEQQWTIKQDGANMSGIVKSGGSDLSMAVKLTGLIFRGTITEGDMHYVVNASVSADGTTMDGTIRMGTHEYLLSAKRSSK